MISEILFENSEIKNRKDKINHLRANDSQVLRLILNLIFHPGIKFALPEEDPKYKPAFDYIGHEMLYNEARKLYLFVEGGHPTLAQNRREQLFIQFLEAIHPADAQMMLSVRKKKSPFPGLTEKLVREAFPDLLPTVAEQKEEVK